MSIQPERAPRNQYHTPQHEVEPPVGRTKEKRNHTARNIIVGAIAAAAVGGAGMFTMKDVYGQSGNTEPRAVPSTSAPAVPGATTDVAPSASSQAPAAAEVNDKNVKIDVLQSDGSTKTYVGESAYIEANQVADPEGKPNQASLEALLKNINTAGHIVTSDPSYRIPSSQAAWYAADAAQKTILEVKPSPTSPAGLEVVDESTSQALITGGLFRMISDDIQKNQIHTFTVEKVEDTSTGLISSTTEKPGEATLVDTVTDIKTGKEVAPPRTIHTTLHFNVNPSGSTDAITDITAN